MVIGGRLSQPGPLARDPSVCRATQEVADDAQRVISANIGRLEVEGEPAGAEVRLNGRLICILPSAALLGPRPRSVLAFLVEGCGWKRHYNVAAAAFRHHRVPLSAASRCGVQLRPADQPIRRWPSRARAAIPMVDRPGAAPWLTWTLAGPSVAAGADDASHGRCVYLQVHAEGVGHARPAGARWTRDAGGAGAGSEVRQGGEALGRAAIAAGVAMGSSARGAATLFRPPTAATPGTASDGCTVGPTGAKPPWFLLGSAGGSALGGARRPRCAPRTGVPAGSRTELALALADLDARRPAGGRGGTRGGQLLIKVGMLWAKNGGAPSAVASGSASA